MDKEWLQEQYWSEERSLKEIGDELGVHPQTVLNRMRKLGIPRRSSKQHTERTKKKLSKMRSGENNYWYGKKRPEHGKLMSKLRTGIKFSEETKQKMAEAKRGLTGPLHNCWIEPDKRKGPLNKNIRRLRKMKLWREAVFERDDYTCCECGIRGGTLQSDHIRPLHFLIKDHNITKPSEAIAIPEIWDLENGRTLCLDCHKKTDTFGAKIRKHNDYRE